MEMYEQAYLRYLEKCEEFGIQAIDPIEFIHNLTPEQIQMMLSQ
ncbi:hypothetical protein GFC29_1317 [Anoxybacillus sp. B7M1]|jgi:hypothetical protein|uniref:Uncharacterized protein n=1 Tax=Anoxybacteroides rupiense TaxID=311460 RepID=A0ABD5IZI9_9BACL|nr:MULTISPECIES: hypothetical protein [Anoxybacillus]ANB57755.1 hypothetical protein GFC28_307 [Anoxybacillus sp. B2M1]ANB64359.1 hypothetical protein GFC29_1317 [Anoxybacillus sp. B7M1]KXG08678.1 hypothetical protein AT864_03095 [Anoxybacillus sp. P3H1B]MBB3906484.1 hypothetical protein [Anoxybacillus rupiensis]MDE8563659.1 hypothetical protein [Anoxybacillus rupiensis]